jgi:hypothetical protein
VVDDDPLVPSIMRGHTFSAMAHVTCDIASNGRQALDLFWPAAPTTSSSAISPCLKMDGIELISALHHQGYAGWLGVITSQHPTLGRTALNIAKVMECALQGLAASRLTGKPLIQVSQDRKGWSRVRVRPAGERTTSLPSMNCARPWTKTG